MSRVGKESCSYARSSDQKSYIFIATRLTTNEFTAHSRNSSSDFVSVLYEFAPVQGVSHAQWVEEVILARRLRLKDPVGVVTQYLEMNQCLSNAT